MRETRYVIAVKETVETEASRKIKRHVLASLIENHYSTGDMDGELIYPLGADIENLPGHTKSGKVQALIEWCANRGRLQELWNLCNETRPNVKWQSALEAPEPPPPPPHTSKRLLLIGLVFGLALGGVVGYFLSLTQDGRATDTLYYDFEQGISSDWRFYNQVQGNQSALRLMFSTGDIPWLLMPI